MSSREYGDIIKNQRRKKSLIAKTLKYFLYIFVGILIFCIGRSLLRLRMAKFDENNPEMKSEKIY